MRKPILTIKDLDAGYKDLQVLKKISLDLKEGSMSVLMGPNGAGKSTLLKSIFNITDVMGGKMMFNGKNITNLPAHRLLELGVGFVSQGRVNFSNVSVRDNLALGAHYIKDKDEIRRRMNDVYEQFPVLKEKQHAHAYSLSGGQQQMLAIGRALMSKPTLMLMDEPSLGLAPKLVKEVFANIRQIKEELGVTVLIVEHNLKSLMDVADEGFILVQGELVAHDTCANLKKSDIMKKVFVGEFD